MVDVGVYDSDLDDFMSGLTSEPRGKAGRKVRMSNRTPQQALIAPCGHVMRNCSNQPCACVQGLYIDRRRDEDLHRPPTKIATNCHFDFNKHNPPPSGVKCKIRAPYVVAIFSVVFVVAIGVGVSMSQAAPADSSEKGWSGKKGAADDGVTVEQSGDDTKNKMGPVLCDVRYQAACFYVIDDVRLTYYEAKSLCQQHGAHLAFITNFEEYNLLSLYIRERLNEWGKSKLGFWTGMTWYENTLLYEDGRFGEFTRWTQDYPDKNPFHIRIVMFVLTGKLSHRSGMQNDKAMSKYAVLCQRN